jgi:hypothetical protein
MHKLSWIAVALCAATATGCDSDAGTAATCETDIEPGEVQPFAEPTSTGTEGIVFDIDGTLYVSAQVSDGPDQLLDIADDGTNRPLVESTSIFGLESDSRGILAASIDTGEVLLIVRGVAVVEVLASGLGAPNFVVTTPWDTMLVSDDTPGEDTIYEVTFEGNVSEWTAGVPTPNGMVFSLDGSFLYVANTFEEPGLWRIPVSSEGEAGTPERWVEFAATSNPDGVAIDSEGNVYVALNVIGEVAKVDPEGNATTLATGVPGVASLAFGKGSRDPCSLYATNLFGTQMFRIGTGILAPR